jgi:uncharacterized protein (TIGR02284 family)
MVTTIGLNPDFNVVLKNLISLDYDAVEAYQAAIDRMDDPSLKDSLADFMADHRRHTLELSACARQLGLEPPSGPDTKAVLTKGKVVLANMAGDRAILMAMKTNEEDTNTAYERAANHQDLPEAVRDPIIRGLSDERRHRAWLVETIEAFERVPA